MRHFMKNKKKTKYAFIPNYYLFCNYITNYMAYLKKIWTIVHVSGDIKFEKK